MKGFNRNRETRLRTSNKQYGRRDEEKSNQKGMLNPDTADRYWRRNKLFILLGLLLFNPALQISFMDSVNEDCWDEDDLLMQFCVSTFSTIAWIAPLHCFKTLFIKSFHKGQNQKMDNLW